MRRRDALVLFGGLATWPLVSHAQSRKPKVGYLSPASSPDINAESFRAGMRSGNYMEGRDYDLEIRFAEGDYSRFDALVSELLNARVDVIVMGGPAIRAAPVASRSVPVVFGFSGDPVEAGIVASFARPGGNVTGVSFLALELAAKRVDILKEVAARVSRLAILSNPNHPGEGSELRATRGAAATLEIQTEYFQARDEKELQLALRSIAASQCNGLVAFPDVLTFSFNRDIALFALEQKLPSIYGWRIFAQNGGLITYGPNLREAYARLATYVIKILKGSSPSSLPVEQPTRIETIVNLRTARQIGLPLSSTLLLRADEVIE